MAVVTFADKPTIIGERVVLRPIVADDADAMFADLADDEALRLTGSQAVFDRPTIERWTATRADADDRLDLAVTERGSGAWLGEVVINEVDLDNRACNFRIALSAHARDRGVGTEATRLVTDHVFGEIEPAMNRISLGVYAFNPRAIAVYERVGFVREGLLRQTLRWNDEYVDEIVMAMLRTDWSQARG